MLFLPGPRLSVAVFTALAFNLQHVAFRRPVLEALLTSRPVLGPGNRAITSILRRSMAKEGVPPPTRREVYAQFGPRIGGKRLHVEVYEPPNDDGATARPAILYFHDGAFVLGAPVHGSGTCAWLAAQGAVVLAAEYRLAKGAAPAIDDAWAAMRWAREHAERLRIDPSKLVVVGDSAGSLLATALATGLGAAAAESQPAACFASWPVTTLGALSYAPVKSADGSWEPTPAGSNFRVENAFVPESAPVPPRKPRESAEATRARLRLVLAGGLLCFGRRWGGLLPAARKFPLDEDAASVSPLTLAGRSGLPPILLLCGGDDNIVPCEQSERFVEAAREAGNEASALIFEGAGHGGGSVNSAAGRAAVVQFLRYHGVLANSADGAAGVDALDGAVRAFGPAAANVPRPEYAGAWSPMAHGRATLRLKPIVE